MISESMPWLGLTDDANRESGKLQVYFVGIKLLMSEHSKSSNHVPNRIPSHQSYPTILVPNCIPIPLARRLRNTIPEDDFSLDCIRSRTRSSPDD